MEHGFPRHAAQEQRPALLDGEPEDPAQDAEEGAAAVDEGHVAGEEEAAVGGEVGGGLGEEEGVGGADDVDDGVEARGRGAVVCGEVFVEDGVFFVVDYLLEERGIWKWLERACEFWSDMYAGMYPEYGKRVEKGFLLPRELLDLSPSVH